jgi:hypothetical protein
MTAAWLRCCFGSWAEVRQSYPRLSAGGRYPLGCCCLNMTWRWFCSLQLLFGIHPRWCFRYTDVGLLFWRVAVIRGGRRSIGQVVVCVSKCHAVFGVARDDVARSCRWIQIAVACLSCDDRPHLQQLTFHQRFMIQKQL